MRKFDENDFLNKFVKLKVVNMRVRIVAYKIIKDDPF